MYLSKLLCCRRRKGLLDYLACVFFIHVCMNILYSSSLPCKPVHIFRFEVIFSTWLLSVRILFPSNLQGFHKAAPSNFKQRESCGKCLVRTVSNQYTE